jgi:hypothetical protein
MPLANLRAKRIHENTGAYGRVSTTPESPAALASQSGRSVRNERRRGPLAKVARGTRRPRDTWVDRHRVGANRLGMQRNGIIQPRVVTVT